MTFYDRVCELWQSHYAETYKNIAELERAMNVGNGVLKKWKYQYPRYSTLKKVAKFFKISVTELLDFNDFDVIKKR